MINIKLGKDKPNNLKQSKEATTEPTNKRQVYKCTMTDILFITLINHIRENGKGGIITISENEILDNNINIMDTKSRLLVDSGFINSDVNNSIYTSKDSTYLKRFMAQNEYIYTNSLFHKTLKFIKDNKYGIYCNTYKLYNSTTRKSVVISDFYDISLINSIKGSLFYKLELLFDDDWTQYIRLINNKDRRKDILQYTKELFEAYFEDREENENKLRFYNKFGINYDIIYPAYIISISDYEQNNIAIDEYIADKVNKLNFDKIDYIEQRSKKGVYKNTYDRILKNYNSIDNIEDALDKELFDLIQNKDYHEQIQSQLYKWYTLSIFDKHEKKQYIDNKEQQKIINKTLKEERNNQIAWFKDEGLTQAEVADMLKIGLRTVQRQWNK